MDVKKLILALLAVGFMISVAEAQTARRAGLNGNQLIEDHDDVYAYPQKAHTTLNQNRVKLDMDDNGGNSGTIFSGNGDAAWGVAISKMGDDAVSNGNYPEAVQTVDAYYSRKSGTGDLGFRLGFASGSNSQGSNAEASNVDINFITGYTANSDAASHDLSLSVDYGMGEVKDTIEGSGMGVTANYRGYLRNQAGENVDLGLVGFFAFGSSTDTPEGGDDAETSGLGAGVGAGPVFRAGDSTVALLAGVGYTTNTAVNDDEASAIFIPGVNVALETPMNDWVTFRGGIGYSKALTTNTPDMGDESTDTQGATTFALGVSAEWKKLLIDVAMNRDFLMNGPYALTGNATPGWASQVSATYAW